MTSISKSAKLSVSPLPPPTPPFTPKAGTLRRGGGHVRRAGTGDRFGESAAHGGPGDLDDTDVRRVGRRPFGRRVGRVRTGVLATVRTGGWAPRGADWWGGVGD